MARQQRDELLHPQREGLDALIVEIQIVALTVEAKPIELEKQLGELRQLIANGQPDQKRPDDLPSGSIGPRLTHQRHPLRHPDCRLRHDVIIHRS